ncbi:hypothetical protein [Pseudomonas donghuensis]|uniref:hypothetical protein n=1 Tax=Pseudomonas donghuensis TaxID=1163398 RepID=UPI002E115B4B|nr:hypothetical protein VP780_09695 [Pseudomonas donghuensis]
MTHLALCLLLLATGASATENVIDVQHDSQRGVTCYLLNGVGISCIPDSRLKLPTTPTPAKAPVRWNEADRKT